ncbi:MAG TPA: 2Fe-2S iron-sulfur cluster-binding protein [Calditerricola sp.]
MDDRFRIRIEPYGKEVIGQAGDTVLQTLMNHYYGREGRPGFYGCRRGGCAACKAELLSGEVEHSWVYSRAALTDEERAQRYILACQAYPRTDLVVRIPERDDPLARILRARGRDTHLQTF